MHSMLCYGGDFNYTRYQPVLSEKFSHCNIFPKVNPIKRGGGAYMPPQTENHPFAQNDALRLLDFS
jgi:hypothetical protein